MPTDDAWQSSAPIRVVRKLILGGTTNVVTAKIMLGAELSFRTETDTNLVSFDE
jgi:hypothetical protein